MVRVQIMQQPGPTRGDRLGVHDVPACSQNGAIGIAYNDTANLN